MEMMAGEEVIQISVVDSLDIWFTDDASVWAKGDIWGRVYQVAQSNWLNG